MPKLTIEVTEEEKVFLDEVAKIKGEQLDDLLKDQVFEAFEDMYDAHVGDLAYKEHQKNPVSKPIVELLSEFGINPEKE
ncbi:type II toxin-antitoxin system RelB family antitoxin [Enterococcus sp. AZ109]|uniref:type II toxin-antitoxin system RelB family antitoxin n=1 Tax=Enterococcus sp. AZ109 TaxID=2774634 RepID=UPI003F210544